MNTVGAASPAMSARNAAAPEPPTSDAPTSNAPTSDAPTDDAPKSETPRATPALRVVSWLVGAAALVAVVVAAQHFSEQRAFIELLERAQPGWIFVAVVLQLGTYLTQALVWRAIARAGGGDVGLRTAFRLSFAKLFVDQALPSGGLRGTMVLVRALEKNGMPRALVFACVVVDGATYYAAYVVALVAAIAIAAADVKLPVTVLALSAVFVVFAMAACAFIIALTGRPAPRFLRGVRRITAVDAMVRMLGSVNLDGLRAAAEGIRQQLVFDVENAQLSVRAAKAAVSASVDAVTASQERFRLAEGRYEEGQGSVIELSDAQLALSNAEAQHVKSEFELAAARAALLKALGR